MKRAHDGVCVIGDTVTVRHAEKAIAAGVDGLMLTCSGAGGQTGSLTPFAFVPKIRAMYGGLLVVAGGIASASGIAAALALGADLAAMGTRFIATPDAAVAAGHREMIVEVDIDDIVVTNAMNGVPGSYMRSSIRAFGLDPNNLASLADAPRTQRPEWTNLHLWRHIFSAGQSVGLIDELLPVHAIVDDSRSSSMRPGRITRPLANTPGGVVVHVRTRRRPAARDSMNSIAHRRYSTPTRRSPPPPTTSEASLRPPRVAARRWLT